MKKSLVIVLGIFLGTLFVSPDLFSRSITPSEKDPFGAEQGITEVEVFPNPSDGRFQLSFDYNGKEKITAKVFDITGKQVMDISENLVIGDTSVTAQVDLENPSSGIYFLRIAWGKTLLTKKIVIR